VGREETIITTSMYDFEILLPHLTYVYWKVHHVTNLTTNTIVQQPPPLVVFGSWLFANDIIIEHVRLWSHPIWLQMA
jgi:hypothetical protein